MQREVPENTHTEFARLDKASLDAVKAAEQQLCHQTGQQIILIAYEEK